MFSKTILIRYSAYLLLFCYICLFFLQKVDLTSSDLGRHIQNGQVILESGSVFETNFYSYTHPDFPVSNHHWLFGVIVFLIYSAIGFNGITLVSALIHCLALFFLFIFLKKRTSTLATVLAFVVAVPLFTYRTEFRPEVFSFLFVIIVYCITASLAQKRIKLWQALLILLPIQIAWVNTHIFFILSLGIVGIFGIQTLLQKSVFKKDTQLKNLFIIGIALIAVSFINPLGLQGVLEPFNIFDNYAYRIYENQGLFFLIFLFFRPVYLYTYLILIGFVVAALLAIKKKHLYRDNLAEFLLCLTFILCGLKMNRLLSLSGVFLIPFLSYFLYTYQTNIISFYKKITHSSVAVSITTTISICLLILVGYARLFFPGAAFGLGIQPDNNRSAEFFKENKIAGPVINNYDIGGYLIFHLYPTEKVFVDNRPEAYPNAFFTEVYTPLQQREELWQATLQQYSFNTIFFYRHDLTEWGQRFLINRVQDDQWAPIFVDDYAIIFVRNNELNKELIEKYRIPREVFNFN